MKKKKGYQYSLLGMMLLFQQNYLDMPLTEALISGVYTANGETVEVSSLELIATTTNKGVLYAINGGIIDMLGGGEIKFGSSNAGAAMANGEGSMIRMKGVDILANQSIGGGGGHNDGLWVDYNGKIIFQNGNITVDTSQSRGIKANSGGMVDFFGTNEERNKITVNGDYSEAIESDGSGTVVNVQYTDIAVNGKTSTVAENYGSSYGLHAKFGGKINLSNSSITTVQDDVMGVLARENAEVNISNSIVKTQGKSSNPLTPRTSYGVYALGNSKVNITNSTISTSGNGSSAVVAEAIRDTSRLDNSMITIKNSEISTTGNSASAVKVRGYYMLPGYFSRPVVRIEDSKITTTGTGSSGIYVESFGDVYLKNTEIVVREGSNAIHASGANNLDGARGRVIGEKSKFIIKGNMTTSTMGEIQMDFGRGSLFTGKTTNIMGKIDFTMNDDAKWEMTGNSALTSLNMNGGGYVHFLSTNQPNGYGLLTVGDVKGNNGIFHMRADLAGDGEGVNNQGDLLIIKNSVAGHNKVKIQNDATASVNGDEHLTIIQTPDPNAVNHFSLTKILELGGFEYDLHAVEGQEEYLELRGGRRTTMATDGGVNLHAGNYMMHNAELQTLMKRMGDLRGEETRAKGGDVWARVHGGKLQSNSDGIIRGFDMNYTGIQIGADHRHNRSDGRGTSYIGGVFGYTEGDLDYYGGKGNTNSTSFGGYWTYIHRNGFYADLVAKYGWMESDYDVLDSAGVKVEGKDIQSDVFSLSFELGRRYFLDTKDDRGEKISVQERKGWYIEPQAQVTISHFGGDRFEASNGLKMAVHAFDSTIARVGTHIGYESKSKKSPVNIYAKGYFMKEFDGKIDFDVNNAKVSTSYEDTWFVYGIGATAKLGERHNLYLDFERWTGGRMEQEWAVNGGYRYSW